MIDRAQPWPGPYHSEGNYIFGLGSLGMPSMLGRLFDLKERPIEVLAATAALMAASWDMQQVLLAEEALVGRIEAANNHIRFLASQGKRPSEDPDPAWQAELIDLARESDRIAELRRQALAKARGEKVNTP